MLRDPVHFLIKANLNLKSGINFRTWLTMRIKPRALLFLISWLKESALNNRSVKVFEISCQKDGQSSSTEGHDSCVYMFLVKTKRLIPKKGLDSVRGVCVCVCVEVEFSF